MTVTPTPGRFWRHAPGDRIAADLYAWAPLGGGRRCESWLAFSRRRWTPVVVKLPRPELTADPQTLADLRQEAEMMAGLTHPGVQRLYDARLDEPVPYLVSEYVEGPTLRASIAEQGPLDVADAALLGLQLAGVLGYLHRSDVVHLDVKPHNVALRDGRPVLLDFGIARRPGQPRRAGAPLGSPPYMAPEQCRDEPARCATDIFALGALLFEAVTGDHPFHPRRTADGWSFPQLCEPATTTDLPAPLRAPLARLLDPVPARRPADGAVLRLLADLVDATDRLWPDWVDQLNAA